MASMEDVANICEYPKLISILAAGLHTSTKSISVPRYPLISCEGLVGSNKVAGWKRSANDQLNVF